MKRIAACSFIAVLMVSCATQKSRNDQSKLGKFYHNVTSKFNGYFNANELLDASIASLEAGYQDNYTEPLPLYKYRDVSNPESVAQSLDEAIKKVSVVATLHENSDWVDDCYLLIGKAQYVKQDYEAAQNALEFFMDEFNRDGTRITKRASKKKKKGPQKKRANSPKNNRKKKSAAAKAAERERKAYNKKLRKNQKKGKKNTSSKRDDPGTGVSKRGTDPSNEPVKPQRGPTGDDVPKDEIKAKRASMEAQNPGGLKHRPVYQEAELWLAKIYIERETYPRAEYFINSLNNNPALQEEVAQEVPVVAAYYALSRDNYAGAIPHLQRAVELANKKRTKARFTYILAQLQEMQKSYREAHESYARVLKLNPLYEMAFNAKLSLARTALLAGDQSVSSIIATLEKMLKDDKNDDYKDQIHFTLAQLALQSNDVAEAIKQLKLAVEAGGRNKAQQTETNYLLATLYFDQPDYVNAKSAYDATLVTMEDTDERHKRVSLLAKNLTEIAVHLTEIDLQDSLLAISQMSETERKELAKKIKKAQKQEEAESITNATMEGRMSKGRQSGLSGLGGLARPASNLGTASSSFFAYNTKTLKRGIREFEKEWGDRPNVDNWRLSSRLYEAGSLAGIDEVDVASAELAENEIADIFSNVPSTDEEKALAHKSIQNAMLQLGSLYRDKLEDYALSIEILEELLRKYPDTEFKLEAYYQLYVSYLSMDNVTLANKYKDKIISEFPDTKYALVLSDPDYAKKQLSEEQALDQFYRNVFALVEDANYAEAQAQIIKSKEKYGTKHALAAKLSILEAMCSGNLQGRETYVTSLKHVIAMFPNTPEATKAKDMLLMLGEYKGSRLNLPNRPGQTVKAGPNFKPQPDALHFVLVVVHNFEQIANTESKIMINDYNRTYHQLDKLKVSSLVFDIKTRQSVILVRSFRNGAKAVKYVDQAMSHITEFVPRGADFEAYPVTQHNYREIIKQKTLDDYRNFYSENYSK